MIRKNAVYARVAQAIKASYPTAFTSGKRVRAPSSWPAVWIVTSLFRAAFAMHHPSIKNEVIDEMWEKLAGKQALVTELYKMHQESAGSLMDEPEEDAGNITWGATE